jgi:hypothetical protein
MTGFARPRHLALLLVTAHVLLHAVGCQPSPEDRIREAMRQSFQLNGKRLAIMYGRCMGSPTGPVRGPNGFKGPPDEASLRAFITKAPAAALKEMGIEDPAAPSLFTSERDQQPFRVRYGVTGPLTTVYTVVCEARGVDGSVRVFKTDGTFADVPASAAESYLAGEHDQVYVPEVQ